MSRMSESRQRGSNKSTKSGAFKRNLEQSNVQKLRHNVWEPWTPSPRTAWKVLLSARLCAALWSGISDCDETFNYWEPVHHLVYGQGMQTWEYDPKYALRSYMYLLMYSLPAWAYSKLFQTSPILVFFFVRLVLACVSASAEVYFYTGVVREFGHNIGRITLGVMCLGAGMFISSTAFLPSSTSMYLTCVAYGAWFKKEYKTAIFSTAVSVLLSWPFTALLGVPIAVDILFVRKKTMFFFTWSFVAGISILMPMIACDTFYYGKPVFASLNIILYNVFTEHGPDLYGTEPASFYLFNGLLNFNLIFLAAVACLPLSILSRLILSDKGRSCSVYLLFQIGLYLWLVVFWTRPHKEERFLFPVYPLILLAGSVTVDIVQRVFAWIFSTKQDYLKNTTWLSGAFLLLFGVLSFSRVAALYQHYHGSMQIWMKVAELEQPRHAPAHVCVGKEWHRFPSSFFLPSTNFRLGFLKSEFTGQLPKYYGESTAEKRSTMLSHHDFNDMNREETSRYVSLDKCDFIVDLENDAVTQRQPKYGDLADWDIKAEFSFLDPSGSHPLFRAFYIPLLNSQHCKYHRYVLLARNHRDVKR